MKTHRVLFAPSFKRSSKRKENLSWIVPARVTHVELAMEDAFQREFLKALAIPYQSTGGPS